MDIQMESLSIFRQKAQRALVGRISLNDFNVLHPGEQLDFRCNCHGFTFTNGKFWIANDYVSCILKDEFIEVRDERSVKEGDYDIICLRDRINKEWIHSCKHIYNLFIHKEGVRKFTIHASKNEIISIPEYSGSYIHHFRKKDRSCPGICLNSVGEKHVPPYANSGMVV